MVQKFSYLKFLAYLFGKNHQLGCTLWGSLVDDFMSCLDKSGEDFVVIILKMCRSKIFKGEASLSTAYHITKILINDDLDEIKDFRKRYFLIFDCQ